VWIVQAFRKRLTHLGRVLNEVLAHSERGPVADVVVGVSGQLEH